jgi:GNAT superfamily N-acetyltransferase
MSLIGLVVFPHDRVSESVLEACSYNFSNYYGIWQDKSRGRVKMSKAALARSYLDKDSQLVVAFDESLDNIIGHAFFKVFHSEVVNREVTWITQLVVRSEYRGQKVAQRMLNAAIAPTVGCAGLVTSHPHAVKALERAMRKKVDPAMCKILAAKVIEESRIEYLKYRDFVFHGNSCLVNTAFAVDHAEPEAALAALVDTNTADWVLGSLLDGHEFVAVILA